MVVAEEAVSMVVDSAVADAPAAEPHALAMAEEARGLGPPGPTGAEAALRAPMELTERGDPAHTAAGHTVARPTARDILVRMAAGLRRHQRVHVTVQLLIAAQTQRQPREITARLALALIAARPQGTPRRQPTAETLRRQHPAPLAGWSLPIDQGLL
jgi:hypothetical protein